MQIHCISHIRAFTTGQIKTLQTVLEKKKQAFFHRIQDLILISQFWKKKEKSKNFKKKKSEFWEKRQNWEKKDKIWSSKSKFWEQNLNLKNCEKEVSTQ